jgi:hypothetical protein
MPVSADMLIRQVKRAAHLPALPEVRILGVDGLASRNVRNAELGILSIS